MIVKCDRKRLHGAAGQARGLGRDRRRVQSTGEVNSRCLITLQEGARKVTWPDSPSPPAPARPRAWWRGRRPGPAAPHAARCRAGSRGGTPGCPRWPSGSCMFPAAQGAHRRARHAAARSAALDPQDGVRPGARSAHWSAFCTGAGLLSAPRSARRTPPADRARTARLGPPGVRSGLLLRRLHRCLAFPVAGRRPEPLALPPGRRLALLHDLPRIVQEHAAQRPRDVLGAGFVEVVRDRPLRRPARAELGWFLRGFGGLAPRKTSAYPSERERRRWGARARPSIRLATPGIVDKVGVGPRRRGGGGSPGDCVASIGPALPQSRRGATASGQVFFAAFIASRRFR